MPPTTPPFSAASARAARLILPNTRRRDTLVALAAGGAMLGFIFFAFYYFSRQADATGGVTGTIIAKQFVPQPETQITFGEAGLSRRAVAGEYSFRLRVAQENGRVYRLIVNPDTYSSHRIGEPFYFIRPPNAPAAH